VDGQFRSAGGPWRVQWRWFRRWGNHRCFRWWGWCNRYSNGKQWP